MAILARSMLENSSMMSSFKFERSCGYKLTLSPFFYLVDFINLCRSLLYSSWCRAIWSSVFCSWENSMNIDSCFFDSVSDSSFMINLSVCWFGSLDSILGVSFDSFCLTLWRFLAGDGLFCWLRFFTWVFLYLNFPCFFSIFYKPFGSSTRLFFFIVFAFVLVPMSLHLGVSPFIFIFYFNWLNWIHISAML